MLWDLYRFLLIFAMLIFTWRMYIFARLLHALYRFNTFFGVGRCGDSLSLLQQGCGFPMLSQEISLGLPKSAAARRSTTLYTCCFSFTEVVICFMCDILAVP